MLPQAEVKSSSPSMCSRDVKSHGLTAFPKNYPVQLLKILHTHCFQLLVNAGCWGPKIFPGEWKKRKIVKIWKKIERLES